MDLDPRRLAVLAVVARTGGVLAAARSLQVTPSAVSQQLARLEREAGVALLVRGGRRIALTAAGTALAERGTRIETELTGAAEDLLTLTQRVTGSVTVAAFPTAIGALLAPLAADLHQRHPGLRLRIVEIIEDVALAGLRAGDVDLVVIERDAADRRPTPRGLRDVPLLDDPYLIAAPTAWPLPGPNSWGDALASWPWVSGPPGSASRSVLDRLARRFGVSPRIEHEALEFPAVLALVAAGLGAALVPHLALGGRRDHGAARWQTVGPPGLGGRRLVCRHRSSRSEPGAAAHLVLEALTAKAATLPTPPTIVTLSN